MKLSEILLEYTEQEKRKLGIPAGAKSRGGRWYVGKKYVGKVQDGKFIPSKTTTAKAKTTVKSKKPTGRTVEVPSEVPGYPHDKKAIRLIDNDIKSRIHARKERSQSQLTAKHARAIDKDPQLDRAVYLWSSVTSAWHSTEKERKALFQTIDNAIEQHGFKVATPLYRGLHFNSANVKFAKLILNKFTTGQEVKLPPSGFSSDIDVALRFALPSTPMMSVLFVINPSKTGVRAMHISEADAVDKKYKREKEVVTPSSKYRVVSSTVKEYVYDKSKMANSAGMYKTYKTTQLTVEIEQLGNVAENLQESIDSKETVLDVLFGDSMRNTTKNLNTLAGKQNDTTP